MARAVWYKYVFIINFTYIITKQCEGGHRSEWRAIPCSYISMERTIFVLHCSHRLLQCRAVLSVGRRVLGQDESRYEKAVVVVRCGRLKPLCEESFAVRKLRKCREVVSSNYKHKSNIIWWCINSFKRMCLSSVGKHCMAPKPNCNCTRIFIRFSFIRS
jgi:hypothetical protein